MVTDPVCNMQIDEQTAGYSLAHEQNVYYFCSEGCQAEFQRHPEDYVEQAPAENGGAKDV